jgi:hypothetical protein
MALAYLTAQQAIEQLTLLQPVYELTGFENSGLIEMLLDPANQSTLELILRKLEERVDQWVGYRIAPTQYTESLGADALSPLACTSNYPIISIVNVQPIPNRLPYYLPTKDTCQIGGVRTINLLNPLTCAIVTYIAGYDPIPAIVGDCIFEALILMIQSGNPVNFSLLDEAAKDVESFQLPSGLKKSWKVSDSKVGQTNADRLFGPLREFKQALQTGGSPVV